jgi:hypothetical protein
MKSLALVTSALFLALVGSSATAAQTSEKFSIAKIVPFDKAVPGQILELHLAGLDAGVGATMLRPEDFRIDITQDGVEQTIRARIVLPILTTETHPDGTVEEMKSSQSVSFVVPRGLHTGEAEVVVSYKGQHSEAAKLTWSGRCAQLWPVFQ